MVTISKSKLFAMAIILLVGSTGFYLGQVLATPAPSRNTVITPGSNSIDCTYVIYVDGTTTLARNLQGDNAFASAPGATSEVVIQNAINALDAGRNWYEKVCLEGFFTVNLQTQSGLQIAIMLSSYTILQIDGTLKLVNSAASSAVQENFMIRVTDNQNNVVITGGEVDGNFLNQNQAEANEVYGVEMGNSHDIWVENMYVHDTGETGIAVEGISYNVFITNNHERNSQEDGIGNQFTSHDVFYTANRIENNQGSPGTGLTIEGGYNIVATANIVQNCTNGIKVARGTTTAPIRVSINGNQAINNTSNGIFLINSVANVAVTGNLVFGTSLDGIIIGEGSGGKTGNVTVTGNTVLDSDMCCGSGHSGILVAALASGVVISSNVCSDNRGTPTQDYGIAVLAGANNLDIIGNSCRGNRVSGILVQAPPGTALTIHNNVGYDPVGKITNFIQGTFLGVCGTGTTVVSATIYVICGTDVILTCTGGTVTAIVEKDNLGNQIFSVANCAALPTTGLLIPQGYSITWTHTGAPTVSVYGN